MGGLRPRPYCSSIFQSGFDALSAHSLDKFEVLTEGASTRPSCAPTHKLLVKELSTFFVRNTRTETNCKSVRCVGVTVMQGRRSSQSPPTVIVIERCALIRECLARCIGDGLGYGAVSFPDIDSWKKASPEHEPSLIVVCARENDFEGLRGFGPLDSEIPVIVISDATNIGRIRDLLQAGARGWFSTNTALVVALEVIERVLAGGVCVPVDALLSGQYLDQSKQRRQQSSGFSMRQNAVLDGLQMEKQDHRLLATHERKCDESAVKVHVHNIMKKLRAKNRTEVGARASAIGPQVTRVNRRPLCS